MIDLDCTIAGTLQSRLRGRTVFDHTESTVDKGAELPPRKAPSMDEIEDDMPSADEVESLKHIVEELTRACDMVEVSAQFGEGKRAHLRALMALARNEAERLLGITRSSGMH